MKNWPRWSARLPRGKKKNWRHWLLVVFLAVYFLAAFWQYGRQQLPGQEENFSQFVNQAQSGLVRKVVVYDDHFNVQLNNGQRFLVNREPGASFVEALKDSGLDPAVLNLEFNNQNWLKLAGGVLGTLLPLLVMAAIFYYFFKQAGRAQNSIFSFTKSRARLFIRRRQTTTFKDVAGLTEAKKELEEVVDFLRHPQKYRRLGARAPKGVLLIGPSGVGKTLLARAVAGEARVPFFSMAGSEFMEMLVGVGASRVRDLFNTAKKAAPAIIFIDEIDAIGRARGLGGLGGGQGERDQTLNQILVEMDGFEANERVVVIAATNRGDLLDPALLRPGRFDRRIVLTLPDLEEREAILKIHARGKPFQRQVSWRRLAQRTVGFSGADLENMLNEAAILAARRGRKKIGNDELEEAALKVKLGPAKKRSFSREDKEITAYHESGHALVTWYLPAMDPVQKISIVSRGLALGFTLIPPLRDRPHLTKDYLEQQITALLGGRAAEELQFKQMTTGAASDIQEATKIARQMVIEYGMSPLGPLNLGPQLDLRHWSSGWVGPSEISPQMQAKVDAAVQAIIRRAYRRAQGILRQHRRQLDAVAKALLIKETLDGNEFAKILEKKQK